MWPYCLDPFSIFSTRKQRTHQRNLRAVDVNDCNRLSIMCVTVSLDLGLIVKMTFIGAYSCPCNVVSWNSGSLWLMTYQNTHSSGTVYRSVWKLFKKGLLSRPDCDVLSIVPRVGKHPYVCLTKVFHLPFYTSLGKSHILQEKARGTQRAGSVFRENIGCFSTD